ncbi:MAG: hypothetical protein IJF01_01385 [Tidjanibacter sp.]|nr:hypothetical protein [Tidjanibacter sp.]
MKFYDLAISVPEDLREKMIQAGIFSKSIGRYIYIYEMYTQLTGNGMPKMDAYVAVSAKCFTCEENVRKIIKKMSAEV